MTFKRMIQAVDTHSGIPMRVITGGAVQDNTLVLDPDDPLTHGYRLGDIWA